MRATASGGCGCLIESQPLGGDPFTHAFREQQSFGSMAPLTCTSHAACLGFRASSDEKQRHFEALKAHQDQALDIWARELHLRISKTAPRW